jgi:hypothetical protein
MSSMLHLVPDVQSSTCTETEKLVQSRLQGLENRWGTQHQKQVTFHWHKEIISVRTAASGQQLRYVSREASPVALTQRNYFCPDWSTWATAEAPVTRSKSVCTDTKKLVQSRLQHVDNSWGTHHQSLAPCTHTKKLVQYRLHHLVNSWGTLTRSHVALSQRN